MRLLLAEDERETAETLRRRLEAAGHVVELVRTGREARSLGATRDFDVALLDRLLPQLDGVSVLRAWREAGVTTPVLMLTRTMLLERVWGYAFDPGTNIVESHLSRLRSKLAEAGGPDPIETMRGAGYRMQVR